MNKVLEAYDLEPVSTTAEFNVGALTLVLGTPETDPLPDNTNVKYIGAILWQKEDVDSPSVDELRTKVRKVLSDPIYTENARKISEKMSSYGGAAEAERLIEGLAN